jgi:tetratricopeptide (TPR) repeat protein
MRYKVQVGLDAARVVLIINPTFVVLRYAVCLNGQHWKNMELTHLKANTLRRIINCTLLLSMLMASIANSIAKPDNITQDEMSLTSPFCVDTEAFSGIHQCTTGRTPKSHYWERVMGKGFCALHHYCWAQIILMRANRHNVSAEVRKRQYGYVINEYYYVIKNSPGDFILLPEIYTRLGQAELHLNNPDKANTAFAKARELKPNYWPAYVHWVNFLIQVGKRADAKALAKIGLENSPDAKVLIEQYQRLGGNLSDIEPRPQPDDSGEVNASER